MKYYVPFIEQKQGDFCVECGEPTLEVATDKYSAATGKRIIKRECANPCHNGRHEYEQQRKCLGLIYAGYYQCKRCKKSYSTHVF